MFFRNAGGDGFDMLDLARRMAREILPVTWRRSAKDVLGLPRVMHEDFASLKILGSIRETHIVFDVGACEGWFSKCWLEYNPTAKVHLFEPVSSFYQKVLPSLRENRNVTLVNAACGAENGQLTLNSSSFAAVNSVLQFITNNDLDLRFDYQELVKVIKLSDYSRALGLQKIKLIKIDVQGFELQVLKGMAEILPLVEYVYVETSVHPVYEGASTFCDIFQYLSSTGFDLLDIKATSLGTTCLRECDLLFKSILGVN